MTDNRNFAILVNRAFFAELLNTSGRLCNRFTSEAARIGDRYIFGLSGERGATIEQEIICLLDNGQATFRTTAIGGRRVVALAQRKSKKERVQK